MDTIPFFIYFYVIMRVKPRDSHMPGERSIPEPQPQAYVFFKYLFLGWGCGSGGSVLAWHACGARLDPQHHIKIE